MTPVNEIAGEEKGSADPAKKPYAAPRLERFGTIRELTQGPGSNNKFDGKHPPGQNKSRL